MNQQKYALELISEAGLSGAQPVTTPMKCNAKLTTADYDASPNDVLFSDVSRYQRLVWKFLYLTNTRPNIAFAIQSLSQYM